MKEINLPESLETIKQLCFCNSGIEEITIPKNVKTIEGGVEYDEKYRETHYGAFLECRNLQKIVLQDGTKLTEIQESAFKYTSLKDIVLGNGLQIIGKEWFANTGIE